MNVNEIILKELDAIPGPAGPDGEPSPDPMKSDEKRFSVSYGMFKDFTVRLKKNQDFAIVGNYVKKQFTSSNHPNKQKAFGNYFYDLNFGSILKTQYVLKIAEPALGEIKGVPDINIMSNVSLQIGQAVKGVIGGLVATMNDVQSSTIKGKAKHNVPDDSDYIGNKMEELTELEVAASKTGDDKDKLRALGVLFSRYYGSLIRDPKEILEKAKRVAGIKKSSTEEVGKEFEEMVINDPTNPAILNFLREGLEKPSEDEIQKGTEALNAFKIASKADKPAMKKAYFELIGSLNYHIKTGFKLFKSEQADAIAELYKKATGDNLFEEIETAIAKLFPSGTSYKDRPNEKYWKSATAFLEGLGAYINIEKTMAADSAKYRTRKTEKEAVKRKKLYRERYEEFKFVAEQPEGKVGIDNVKDFYSKALAFYKAEKYKEANDMLDKIKKKGTLGESSWAEIKKKIAGTRIKKLEEKWKAYKSLAGEPKPPEFEELKGQIYGDKGLISFYKSYTGDPDHPFHDRQRAFDKTINNLDNAIKYLKKKKSAVNISDKDLKAIESDPKGFGGLDIEEQLTKKLAPYLMERIKNRKPIDNRLINMIKPRKSQKGKSK
jgi:hypothetical protein